MSDAIREAFETDYKRRHGGFHPVSEAMFDWRHDYYIDGAVDDEWQAWKGAWQAALQSSQTAPAVPEEEVKARGFEEYANLLEAEAHDLEGDDLSRSELLMDSALDARSHAARLRASQQEGGEG